MCAVVAMSVGSMRSPLGFLALALKPAEAGDAFGAVTLLSVTATTVGYGGAASYVARVIVHSALVA